MVMFRVWGRLVRDLVVARWQRRQLVPLVLTPEVVLGALT